MRASALLLSTLFLVACSNDKAAEPAAPTAAAQPAAQQGGLAGTVSERLDTDQYSYLKLDTAEGEQWAAVPRTEVAPGTQVTIANPMVMNDFESKTLNRTFETVVFGTLAGQPAGGAMGGMGMGAPAEANGAPHGDMGGEAMGMDHPAPTEAADVGDLKVEKATGDNAYTVAEVYAQKGDLVGKQVQVRGKVVKYNAEILGKNWLHIRDASGSEDKGDHDLTVTTSEQAAVGDTVLVTGTVATDKDFGAGYRYPVIVEEAQVQKN